MLNYEENIKSSIQYWENQPTDQPWLLNGFTGTWDIKDHSLIPEPLLNFLAESFHGYTRLSRVPLDDINKALNDIWQGPGSMPNVIKIAAKLRISRRETDSEDAKDPLKGYDTPTIESNLGENVIDKLEK